MSIHVVGLTGSKRAGKSTICSMISEMSDISETYCFNFAAPLKMACHIMFGGTVEHWFGNSKEVILPHLGKTPRELMQKLGTEFCRDQISESIWVDCMYNQIIELDKPDQVSLVLIDDLRFEDEAKMLRDKFNASVFRINVEDEETATTSETHRSELGIPTSLVSMNYFAKRGDIDSLRNISKAIYKSIVFSG